LICILFRSEFGRAAARAEALSFRFANLRMELALDPDSAAEWMAQRILTSGRLAQSDAAHDLLAYGDDRLAYYSEVDNACVGRPVLRRLRRDYPQFRFDRRLKAWRRS
jgi:hypothetical protein